MSKSLTLLIFSHTHEFLTMCYFELGIHMTKLEKLYCNYRFLGEQALLWCSSGENYQIIVFGESLREQEFDVLIFSHTHEFLTMCVMLNQVFICLNQRKLYCNYRLLDEQALLWFCSAENYQIIEFGESLREQEFDLILSHTQVPSHMCFSIRYLYA